jgi:hypothetical protein
VAGTLEKAVAIVGFRTRADIRPGLRWQGRRAVEIEPVSGRRFQKTGIFQASAGDCRRFRPEIVRIGSVETKRRFAKSRHWRAFIGFSLEQSLVVGLLGWRRSADRTCLHVKSLLRGNFTGKLAILVAQRPDLWPERCAAATSGVIPYSHEQGNNSGEQGIVTI